MAVRLAPLGRQLVQMAFVLLCCSFTGTRPRILVPPNSIATTLEDLEAGQEERQEARRLKLTISEHLCQPLICLRDLLQTSLSLSAKSPSSPSFQDFGMIRSMMGSRGSTEKFELNVALIVWKPMQPSHVGNHILSPVLRRRKVLRVALPN